MDKLGYPGDLGTLVSQELFGIGHRFFPISGYPGDLAFYSSRTIFLFLNQTCLVDMSSGFAGCPGYPGDLAFALPARTAAGASILQFWHGFLGTLEILSDYGGGLCAFGARSSTLPILRSNSAARTTRIHQDFLKFRVPWRSWVHGWNPGDLSNFIRILGISGSGDLLA